MSFSTRPGQGVRHLDLTGDREVVYCHQCSNEWYNDEHGLECPRCHNDVCEIITPENDPRDLRDESPDHDFPDPDEDDIAMASPYGLFNDRPRDGHGPRPPIDPSSQEDIMRRFHETLTMVFGAPPGPGPGPPPRRAEADADRERFFGGSPAGHTTRVYTSPLGSATVTFATTSAFGPGGPRGPGRNPLLDDDFNLVLGNVLGGGGIRPPQTGNPGLEGGIQGLFSLLAGLQGGPNAIHGDAVYSQEALDRIITQLMDAHPQSNAAPPASEAAIDKLEKKKLDKDMMGDSNKAECTICIDEMHIGDEVTVLPCKHWFHGECVVLWLKEHNTCPICRNPIEKSEDGGDRANGGASGGGGGNSQPGASPGGGSGSGGGGPMSPGGARFAFLSAGPGGITTSFGGGPPAPSPGGGPNAGSRFMSSPNMRMQSPEELQRRLDSIRNLAGPSSYGQQSPSESFRSRRDSWSPIRSPAGGSSARNRSPVRSYHERPTANRSSSGRSGNNNNNNGGGIGGSSNSSGSSTSSSVNPLSWIRDRFGGSSSSRDNSNNNNNNGSSRRRS